MKDLELMFRDYRLTTAEIFYHLPDYPSILQSYLWQELDINPDFPVLREFLEFWERKLDGRLHSVSVESCDIIKASDFSHINNEFIIH